MSCFVGDWAGFDSLLGHLKQSIGQFPDNRKGKNTSYDLEDFALAAFSVFFTQSPSFLSHQQYLEDTQGKNNARTLFGIQRIPWVKAKASLSPRFARFWTVSNPSC